MKPKVLIDIRGSGKKFLKSNSGRSSVNNRINLSYFEPIRIPFKFLASFTLVLFFFVSFVLNLAIAPSHDVKAAGDKIEERKALESQLAALEKQIDEYQAQIVAYKKQGNTLQSEIKRLNSQIAKINLQIKAITLTLQKVNKELESTQKEIGVTETKMDIRKRIITQMIQTIYQNERQGMLTILLANNKISDFFTEMNNLANVQDQLRINLEELMGLHTQLSDQKETLAAEQLDVVSLKTYQEAQMQAIKKTKLDKDELLKVTKGKETEYQKILTETQKTAAQIRSRIFEMIGGGEMSFGDAYKFAKYAESKTGVRAALILAVLDRESALGKNVGQCKYDENPYYPAKASNKTSMHPTRDIPVFLTITQLLGLNPDTLKVSCPIIADGAYGGGMGSAQFIPSTWDAYKDRIGALSGNNPPSPWNNMDAFIATALYLKDAGADKGTFYAEKVAAAKYYAGARWSRYLSTYGARVIDRAQQFEQDIATLNA
ncbi:MAG: lytic murein transglycosylase [Patescibacteria group bacterium]|nr:lytic murein transglycosylase [Patescibacteria group bacterium]